ncbi:hypothetical protein JFT91_26785 [Pseudomonas sp. TH08]|uniref:hypothetical protein n=1 Tax=unclassified Pseudomonas TaxID=196821 RepID=UPI001914320D|nr:MULTISPECIES: hypothetical protein [unclassified Pseudomonas]MBK5530887.1 hypothetical protein [Pseudomonas sp. TH06]MBK5536143.1 hypothetical protein [Pseudomonas sp. TH08]
MTFSSHGADPIACREPDRMPPTPSATTTVTADDTDALSFMADKPAFLSSDDAAACLHGLLKLPRRNELHWFILKSSDGRFYCAQRIEAEASAVQEKPPEPAVDQRHEWAVTAGANGQLIVPKGFSLEASFHARPAKVQGADEATTEWVQRNRFFTIADLSAVMNMHRKYSKCYLSAGNGGLLLYTSSNLPYEQELSPRLAPNPDGDSRRFQSLYEEGSIPSSLWILLALAAGEINVVVAGDLWRHRGRLKASWRSDILQAPPPIKLMPIFGPICRNAKKAAVYLQKQIAALPSANPHVGFILRHNVSEFLVVTVPLSRQYAGFDRSALFPKNAQGQPRIPRGFRVHGIYHSIQRLPANRLAAGGTDLHRDFFSPADLKISLERVSEAPHQRIFAITPDGAVLRFAKPIMPKVHELIAALAPGPEQKIDFGAISVQVLIDKVANAGILSVLLPSATWPETGRVRASSTAQKEP